MEYPEVLIRVAEFYGGELNQTNSEFYVRIDTEDRTAKENYDEILDYREDIDLILEDSEYICDELWSDHDTQIVGFVLKKTLKLDKS